MKVSWTVLIGCLGDLGDNSKIVDRTIENLVPSVRQLFNCHYYWSPCIPSWDQLTHGTAVQPLLNTSEKLKDYLKNVSTNNADQLTTQWQIQGRGRGDRASPLFLAQTEARKANKFFFLETTPPLYLRVWMTAPPSHLSEGLHPPLQPN